MGMFLNYHNISDNYVPNNLINTFPGQSYMSKLNPLDTSKPFEEYNTKGELIGYSWRYGETLNLEFNIDGEITLEPNALIMKATGQTPTVNTSAKVGQRAYNIVDLQSWTCVSVIDKQFIWEKDSEFIYPVDGTKSVYISAKDYLADKTAQVTLYDFRMEPICQKIYPANPTVVFMIDKELSSRLQRGIYYCSLSVFNENVQYTIFDPSDCSLLVK